MESIDMATWVLDDCRHLLNGWELDFVATIYGRLEAQRGISSSQQGKLTEIFCKVKKLAKGGNVVSLGNRRRAHG